MRRCAVFSVLLASCSLVNDYGIFTLGDAGQGGDAGSDAGRDAGGELSCTGEWGAPERILEDDGFFQSPALTEDELTMYYGAADTMGGPQTFRVSRRSSRDVPFGAGQPVPELESFCAAFGTLRTIDVSPDGRRLYFSCYESTVADSPLYVADRTDAGTFEIRGAIGTAYCCAAVVSGELEMYASGMSTYLSYATRSTATDPFGPPGAVPGLEATEAFSPDLAPDGLSLFVTVPSSGPLIHEFVRPQIGDPFDPSRRITFMPEIANLRAVGGVEISADCRSLYVAAATEDAAGAFSQPIFVLRR